MYRRVEDGVGYWAVSDIAATDLDKFVELFRTTAAGSIAVRVAQLSVEQHQFRRASSFVMVAISLRRARASRDITVPIGTPVTSAISR